VKTKGKFIAILATLGLLMATIPTFLAAGAVAGTISLSGGVVTDSVRWYSTNTGFDTVTVSVTDADKNVLNDVAGTCTSGALVDFKCTLVGVAGATSYTMNHLNLQDSNQDDIPDALLMRALQGEASGLFKSGTSAATGVVLFSEALDTAVHQNLLTAAVAVSADAPAGGLDVAVSNYAKIRAVVSDQVTTGELATAGIQIKGTSVDPITFVEVADDTETVLTGAVVDGSYDTVKFWKAGTVSFAVDVDDDGVDPADFNGSFNLQLQELGTIAARYKYNQADTITGRTTLVSGAQTAVTINLDLTETNPSSGVFTTTVVLTDTLNEHNTGTPKKVYVTDGALMTFTYNDEDPVASKTATARADLKAPTLALTGPVQASYTNVSALTFIVTVTDEASADGKASGITVADINNVVVAGTASSDLTPLLVGTNSFKVSYSQTISGQGVTNWWLPVKDNVGNTPVFVDPIDPAVTPVAIRGAGDPDNQTTEPAKPYKVTIDTAAPTIIAANVQTGGKLTTATTTPFATTWSADESATKNVTVEFSSGVGTAPLDSTTLSASAWTVGGNTPSTAAMDTAGEKIVLTMATALLTDAKPKVEFVTVGLKDKATNSVAAVTGTAAPTAKDQLAPVITVTSSSTLAEKEVTITVSSSEALGLSPTIKTTPTEPADGAIGVETALAVTQATTTTWTAKYPNPTGEASKLYVVVRATDTANINAVVGDDVPAKDLVSFQVDDKNPSVTFQDADGQVLVSTNQQEGGIWIVANFDDVDFVGDTLNTVTVTAMSLKVKSGAATSDVVADLFTSDSKSYTLAVNLAPATYTFSITGADTSGNSVTTATDFKVIARTPFSLALKPGVNLISIPGVAQGEGGSLSEVFKDLPVTSVVMYDAAQANAGGNPWLTSAVDAAGTWTGDIMTLMPGNAYFVTATASTTAKILIAAHGVATPPTVAVTRGFNSIGFWSIADADDADLDAYLGSVKWTVAYSFDPTPTKGWEVLRPDGDLAAGLKVEKGKGYFVFVSADGTLTP